MPDTLAPALKILVARARSRLGNHCAVALMEAGKVSRFAQTHPRPQHKKSGDTAHEPVGPGGDAPGDDGDGEADFGPETVHKPAEGQHPEAVSELKRGIDEAVIRVGPVQFIADHSLAQAQDLPVRVVDGRGKKQQRANDPAVIAKSRWRLAGGIIQLLGKSQKMKAIQALNPTLQTAGAL